MSVLTHHCVSHLKPSPCPHHKQGVKDSPELRAAVEEVQPDNVALGLRLSQSKPLYQAYKALRCVDCVVVFGGDCV